MLKMKTPFTATLMTLALTTGLFSCNKKQEQVTAFKPRLDPDTKCQITIAGNYKNFEALEAEFDRFTEFYPQVELSYSYLDNYKATIKSAMAGQAAPDVFMTFPWMLDFPDYKELLDCAENMDDEKNLGFNFSTLRSQLIFRTADGQVPIIPVLSGSYGMLVNEAIFKKEGLAIPATYKDLVTSCKTLKEAGYKSPVMVYLDSFMGLPLVYSYFCNSIQNNPEAVGQLNRLDPAAGQYLRPTLEWVQDFMEKELIDIEYCRTIKNKYNAVIMRFFEGNVPIMLCDTDTVSGTLKRESQSDSFMNSPFIYSFHTFPCSDTENDFLNSVAVGFSVNKNSENLAMSNEFMRFLTRTEELNNLAKIKRLISTSTDYSFDEIYSSLSKSTPLYSNEIGLMDSAIAQMRKAVESLMLGNVTIDQAVERYGNFSD